MLFTMIDIDTFKKVEMRIGTILTAEKVEGADKLLRLTVDFGPALKPEEAPAATEEPAEVAETEAPEEEREVRQIISGIAEYVAPEALVGKQCPFVTNLEPRMIRGLESQGMIVAVHDDEGFSILEPTLSTMKPGTRLG